MAITTKHLCCCSNMAEVDMTESHIRCCSVKMFFCLFFVDSRDVMHWGWFNTHLNICQQAINYTYTEAHWQYYRIQSTPVHDAMWFIHDLTAIWLHTVRFGVIWFMMPSKKQFNTVQIIYKHIFGFWTAQLFCLQYFPGKGFHCFL